MRRKIFSVLCAIVLHTASVDAEETNGSIELDGKYTSVKGQKAKFNEYSEQGSGVKAKFFLDVGGLESNYLSFKGENIGYNEDSTLKDHLGDIELQFGKYENYKLKVYHNSIIHNYTFDARTFLDGLESSSLTGRATATPTTWGTTFDYSVERKNVGAAAELSFKSPFFFGLKYDRTEQTGLYPLGINVNTFTEFPATIDTATDNVFMEAGYRSRQVIFKVDGLISSFTQNNPWMSVAGGTTPISMGSGSDLYKVGGSLMVQLPLNSALMARANYSLLENDMDLRNSGTASAPQYNGNISNTTASVALTSNPLKALDVRLYYNLLDRKNDSTAPFRYASADGVAANARTTGNFAYTRQNAGLDAGYRFPAKSKVTAGYEYLNINRADSNTHATTTSYYGNLRLGNQDHIMFVEAKNSYLQWVSGKVRYQHLIRTGGNWTSDDMAAPTAGNETLPTDIRPYYTADKTQDSVKLGLEFEPVHNLDFGVEYIYKQNDYSNTRFGVTKDNRHELYIDANYRISIFNLNPFFDFEHVESDLSQKVGTSLTTSPTVFNWNALRKDVNYAAGAKIDIDIIKNVLRGTLGYRYENTDGTSDFTNKDATATLQDIPYVESSTRHRLTASLNYKITKAVDIICGYTYDKLHYNDWQLDDYSYVISGGGYATGAYANPNYSAHLGHLGVAYKF